MANYNYKGYDTPTGVVRYTCGAIFCLFSLVYLLFMQGELLCQAQYVLSEGRTSYSITFGAIIITLILQIIQWAIARYSKLPSQWHALTYIPSFMTLAMLTSFNPDSLHKFTFGTWSWMVPLMVILYIALVIIIRVHHRHVSKPESHSIFLNCLPCWITMMVLMLLCSLASTVPDTYLYELKTERLLMEGKPEKATEVGKKSLATSLRLTNLRMYALSLQDKLADNLFDYPQEYKSEGLISLTDTNRKEHRTTAYNICQYLGDNSTTQKVIPAKDYIRNLLYEATKLKESLLHTDSLELQQSDSMMIAYTLQTNLLPQYSKRILDYYLCAQLLEGETSEFLATIRKHIDITNCDSLPKAYREALVMADYNYQDSLTRQRYESYQQMCDTLPDPVIRSNLTRRKFGNTLWWYVDNLKGINKKN